LKLRKYETLIIARPELNPDQIKELVSRLEQKIADNGGKLIEVSDWGLRKLAYPIRIRGEKFFYGHYFLLVYAGNGQVIKELEDYMKLIDETFRFQTVKLADKVEALEEEVIWREELVPEVRLREDGEGLEVVEPPRERRIPKEQMVQISTAPKLAEEKKEEAPAPEEQPPEEQPEPEEASASPEPDAESAPSQPEPEEEKE